MTPDHFMSRWQMHGAGSDEINTQLRDDLQDVIDDAVTRERDAARNDGNLPTRILKALIRKIAWGKETKKRLDKDWRSMVYQPFEADDTITVEEWNALKYAVIKRDHQRCKRCDRRFKINDLSAHHIIARKNGGSNDMTNLVTLCSPCHDFVEGRFSTLAEIIGSHESKKKDRTEDHEPIHYSKRPDWHQYVYGGRRRSR